MSDIDVKSAVQKLNDAFRHKVPLPEDLAPKLIRQPEKLGTTIRRDDLGNLLMPGGIAHSPDGTADDRHFVRPTPLTDKHGLPQLDPTELPAKVCAHAKERMAKKLGDKPHGGKSHKEYKRSLKGC